MAYLTCSNLAIGYAGDLVASNITFSVNSRDALFVIGENGAGKSTLIRTLLGLMQPLSGEIDFGDGASLGEVGYLPQRDETQRDFPASAWEVVLSGRASRLGFHPFYSRNDKRAAEQALQRVDASPLRGRPFGSLSGGQQQRVLLARALVSNPRLLILDEPTTGLDPAATEKLYATIDELRIEGAGIIAVTHDLSAAISHATHMLEIGDGEASFSSADNWQHGRSM